MIRASKPIQDSEEIKLICVKQETAALNFCLRLPKIQTASRYAATPVLIFCLFAGGHEMGRCIS